MFKLTEALVKYCREVYDLPADASHDQVNKLILEKIQSGELTFAKLAELTVETKPDAKTIVKEAVIEGMTDVMRSFGEQLTRSLTESLQGLVSAAPLDGAKSASSSTAALVSENGTPTPAALMTAAAATRVRLKPVAEMYDNSTKVAVYPRYTKAHTVHPLADRPVVFAGMTMNEPSELAKAVNGAYIKLCIQSQLKMFGLGGRLYELSQHEKDLIDYALHELPWTGQVNCGADLGTATDLDFHRGYTVNRQRLDEKGRKDILDDALSGGINAVPVTFDDAIVLTPVLFGELFPLVEVVNWPRGRLIDGSTMNNPSWTWGTAEGTAITPFNTTAFIAAMDTTIYPIVGACELGLDFESDTPIDIGANIIRKFGETLMYNLDAVIANGNGTTQPMGLFVSPGTTVVPTSFPNGPTTLSDYEGLFFGLQKQFRHDPGGNRVVFVSNDTTYARSRSIPRGPNDAQRLLGMAHASYQTLDIPHKIQNDIPNTKCGCFNMAGYRMYRRLGMTVRIETGGRTLALKNERLIVVRARFGGRLTLGGYGAIATTFPT